VIIWGIPPKLSLIRHVHLSAKANMLLEGDDIDIEYSLNIFILLFFPCRENLISFLKKSTVTPWINVQHNGAVINLPVSRAKRIFDPDHPQRTH
jgi:hypothetical protein